TDRQVDQSIAMDAAGNFVIAWDSRNQDGTAWAMYARRYSAAGTALSGEFLVETFTPGNQRDPAVEMDPLGNFIVTWQSDAEGGSGYGVYVQRYGATGAAQGSEFRVNTYTTGTQANSDVKMDASGDFIIAWNSGGQDGSSYGIYAQQQLNTTPPTVT